MECEVPVLSGYRLGGFNEDLGKIAEFLNDLPAHIIALPCDKIDDEKGRGFICKLAYVKKSVVTGVLPEAWSGKGARWLRTTGTGAALSLTPKMSWQVWRHIPVELVDFTDEFRIN